MKRILIADDNPLVRRGLRHLIERHREWKVVAEAKDGRDVVDRARELHPDVVVLDLVMPNMNGLEAARELAKTEPQLPILLCTVQWSPHIVDQARKSGARGAVSKSEAGQIADAIAALIEKRTFYSGREEAPTR